MPLPSPTRRRLPRHPGTPGALGGTASGIPSAARIAATTVTEDLCTTPPHFDTPPYLPQAAGGDGAPDQIDLLHCHHLEHEDDGMMLRAKVA